MAALSVAVIGGGIIGCAAAHELAERGCRVTLLERASPGAEASLVPFLPGRFPS